MSLNLVSEQLLSANGLNHQDLFAILGQLTERRLDYGDLYFQSSYHESWVLEDSIIKDGSYNIDQGVGVRAVSGEKTGFAYADQISKLALEQSAQGGADHCARHRQWQSADPRRRRASCPVHQHRPAAEYDPGREAGYSAPGRQSRPGGGPSGCRRFQPA